MVVGNPEIGPLADIIFVIEGTAINGAYLNDIKSNYIIPTLEYFCQGTLEERDYIYESTSALYGIIVYHAADRLPSPSTDIYGPYSNPHKVLQMLDKIELVGGRGESHANVAEALAASLVCLEDLQQRREAGISPQKHCILVCNSPPYLMPVTENQAFAGNTAEQLASIFTERNVHLSILSPRKIPALFKLYEKAGGDLTASQTKNYAKDPRHLVLLKGFSLKERPVSPTATHNIGVASLSSPLPSQGSPMPAGPQPPPPQANQAQPIIQGSAGGGAGGGRGFVQGATAYNVRPPSRWPMLPPQQRLPPPGSALIEQLTRPPTAIATPFNNSPGMNPTTALSQQQQQQQQQAAAAAVAAQQQQQQQAAAAAAVAAAQQQQQQQMRILGTQGVMQSQQGVMSQPQQQGILNQQQTVMSQQSMLAGNQQMGQTVIGQPQQPNQVLGQNQQPNQQQAMPRERHTIWQGILEWIEKTKNPSDPQKLTRSVPCQVSANSKDGEPELKADSWPQKLIMQLMPKQLIGNIGGPYLKNSKSVLFHPTTCEALDSLTKVMSSGFAGCVHFPSTPSTCDIKVLILLYSPEKRAYLGFIPNDQTAFVDRLRKVIQQQKTTGLTRQPQTGAQGGQGMAMQGAAGQPAPQQQAPTMGSLLQQSAIPQQQQQQTLNTGMAAGGVGQPGGPILSNMQPDQSQQQNSQGSGQPGFTNHMVEAARQENLVKIQRLRQTLEAAQQQEIQYKNQLEIMNHMKIQQMQDNLQHAQQQEIQYKTQLEQEQQKQLRAQLQQIQQQQQQQQQGPPQGGQQANQQQVRGIAPQGQAAGQQRMMRPAGISNNPGLRHLLQQPQYRLNMQQQMPRAGLPSGAGQNNQPQQFDDVSSYDFLN